MSNGRYYPFFSAQEFANEKHESLGCRTEQLSLCKSYYFSQKVVVYYSGCQMSIDTHPHTPL